MIGKQFELVLQESFKTSYWDIRGQFAERNWKVEHLDKDIEQAFEQIELNPGGFQVQYDSTRCCFLKRSNCLIQFEIDEDKELIYIIRLDFQVSNWKH